MIKVLDKIPSFVFIIIPIVLRVLTTTLFKFAAISIDEFTFMAIITNYLYIICFFFFFLRALAWQVALTRISLSIAYPLLSLGYISLLAVGYLVFDEEITIANIVGTLIIGVGIILLVKEKGLKNSND